MVDDNEETFLNINKFKPGKIYEYSLKKKSKKIFKLNFNQKNIFTIEI